MKKFFKVFLTTLTSIMLFSGCSPMNRKATYKSVEQEEAKRIMRENDGYIILDVRREDEFNQAHIPGAICVPNETILNEMPKELPDKEQMILVYCRSGNRSKQAAQKLADMGYKNIIEFGGIMTWTGETVSE